jgi:hypothetical protein
VDFFKTTSFVIATENESQPIRSKLLHALADVLPCQKFLRSGSSREFVASEAGGIDLLPRFAQVI